MRRRMRHVVAVTAAAMSLTWSLAAPTAFSGTDDCEGMTRLQMPDGSELCTHGDDAHLGTHVAADGATVQPLRAAPVQCYADGVDGYRVSVLYVHAKGSPNRVDEMASRIRRDVAQVEGMIADSAAGQGGTRHVRWETEASGDGCRVKIESVSIPRGHLDDLMQTVRALADRGYARTDRRYALYVDHDRYCGIATMPRDEEAGAGNVSNRRTGYARVDRSCWNRGDTGGYSTMGHELVHSLGAVQTNAPNATSGGHCTDEWDPLCYDDGTGSRTRVVCRSSGGDADLHHRQLDCGADDYFAVSPRGGSYLARNWNTADSPYLATTPGYGTGASPTRDDAARWPATHGTWLPSSASAGFAACDAPIVVETRGRSSSSVLGSGVSADSSLVAATRDVVRRVNELAGFELLRLGDAVDRTEPSADTLLVERAAGGQPGVRAWTSGGRTTRAVVSLPGDRAPVAVSLGPVLEALGLGSTPWGDAVTGRLGGSDATGTSAALQHLYGSGCSTMHRLDLGAGGHPSQLAATADRRSLDIGAGARTPVDLGVEVSTWLRQQAGGASPRAVVCRDDVAADCLAGAGLLTDGGSLLFVPGGPGGSLPGSVADELRRTVRAGGEVIVLGGPDAIAPRVVSQLEAALPSRTVRRLYGDTRYHTAAAIARTVAPRGADRVLLARGDNPADATAAAALALRDGMPVLLTANDHLSGPAAAYLRDTGSRRTVLLGGPHALTSQVDADVNRVSRAVRVAGPTRTATAVAIARSRELWNRTSVRGDAAVVAVSGYGAHAWQTALAAAPVAAHLDAPITYLAPDRVPAGEAGAYDTAEYVAGLEVRGSGTVRATSVVVGARLGGVGTGVTRQFHALLLPALRDRIQLVTE